MSDTRCCCLTHNTAILPKPVYDCVEVYCLGRLSDLLPAEMRGAPEDIDPVALHDAIVSVAPKTEPIGPPKSLAGRDKLRFISMASSACAWKRMLYLKHGSPQTFW